MSKSKPRAIRRHGPSGPQEIVQPLDPPPSPQELLTACIRLGQDQAKALQTIVDYREEMIDMEDAKMMHEEIRTMRAEERQAATVPVTKGNTGNSVGTHINPRDPNSGLHPQKVTRRDQTGRVVGLDNV